MAETLAGSSESRAYGGKARRSGTQGQDYRPGSDGGRNVSAHHHSCERAYGTAHCLRADDGRGPAVVREVVWRSRRAEMRVQLRQIAHARSGDKGDDANIGLIALKREHYEVLVREVTAERVKRHFAGICHGDVERYELPNLNALNFVLHHALDGGGLVSLRMDNQGKTYGAALLRMEIDVP